MKRFYFLPLFVCPLIGLTQSSPATGDPIYIHYEETINDRDFGDTIHFDGLTSGTVVTDQYASSHGAKFSGWPVPNYCDTYDYVGLYGSVLKSSTWYDGIRIDFVNPIDTSESVAVCTFGMNNPIDSEIDYIVLRFYDANDNLLYTYHSVSPELVNINLGTAGATYVTMEDENDSAYVIDDIWFEAGCPANVDSNNSGEINVYPVPCLNTLNIDPANQWIGNLNIYDMTGKLIEQVSVNSSTVFQIDLATISPGLYVIKDTNGTIYKTISKQ